MPYDKDVHLEYLKQSIKSAIESGMKMQAEILVSSCCFECMNLKDVTFTLEQIKRNPPLPYRRCTNKEGCNCIYHFQPILLE